MSGSPISGSNVSPIDPIEHIWVLSVRARDGHDIRNMLAAVSLEDLSTLERTTCLAVGRHIITALRLANGELVDNHTWTDLFSLWDDVLKDARRGHVSLTPRSHAFHMRLANKYADYYRTFEQKSVEQWVSAARYKSEFLQATAVARTGELGLAAELVDGLSLHWRESLSARLPGLYVIEKTGAEWAKAVGNAALSQMLMDRFKEGSGRLAPYDEDEPMLARPPRDTESTFRFAFAASIIPTSLTK